MLALKTHWRNWRNRQLLKLFSRYSGAQHQQRTSHVCYSVNTDEARKATTDLYLEMTIVLHTFSLGSTGSIKIDVHMGEVVAQRCYLDNNMSLQRQTKRFYVTDKDQYQYLLRRWVPWIQSVKEISNDTGHDSHRERQST